MEIKKFIENYREAFGEYAESVSYTHLTLPTNSLV